MAQHILFLQLFLNSNPDLWQGVWLLYVLAAPNLWTVSTSFAFAYPLAMIAFRPGRIFIISS